MLLLFLPPNTLTHQFYVVMLPVSLA
jgi:hypothetical protein